MADYNLDVVQLCGHTWAEQLYKFSALGDTNSKIRQAAIDRVIV